MLLHRQSCSLRVWRGMHVQHAHSPHNGESLPRTQPPSAPNLSGPGGKGKAAEDGTAGAKAEGGNIHALFRKAAATKR